MSSVIKRSKKSKGLLLPESRNSGYFYIYHEQRLNENLPKVKHKFGGNDKVVRIICEYGLNHVSKAAQETTELQTAVYPVSHETFLQWELTTKRIQVVCENHWNNSLEWVEDGETVVKHSSWNPFHGDSTNLLNLLLWFRTSPKNKVQEELPNWW